MELADLDIRVFDCEVYAHDWLFCFKRRGADERFSVWNDAGAVRDFLDGADGAVLCGFNSKHYDQYILKAVLAGCEPEEVKDVNDWIIAGNTPWEHPYLRGLFTALPQTDLMDDMQVGTSLKSIEAHLGRGIVETSVPFDIDRPLTPAEREEVERYCWEDVDATEALLELRGDYLATKLHLASYADIDPVRALGMTDPKLAAAIFKAEAIADIAEDERDYEFPESLDYGVVPADVVEFFERIRDPSVGDEELFKSQHVHRFAGCDVTFAFGGLHGAVPKLRAEARPGRLLLNYDAGSLYPSLMINFGYVSRAVPSPDVFRGIRDERFEAKAAGDKRTANSLKSPLNKAYGAMGNRYNPMYDPKNKLSVCVSGQLAVAELMARYEKVEGLRIIQANTDGVAIDVPEGAYGEVLAVNDEWSERTGFLLEEDRIDLLWQKDVNNYAMRKTDGSEKVKGSYLVRGISPIGAWSINNNAVVVAEALKRWLLDGVPVAETITACDDPMAFQLVAKASGKYSEVFQVRELPHGDPREGEGPRALGELGVAKGGSPPRLVGVGRGDGYIWELGGRGRSRAYELRRKVPMQRCNRVFATRDPTLGRLYKVKRADGSVARIESLPEHCLVCNDLPPSILNIDKSWYIALAERRALDFEKEEKLEENEVKEEVAAKKPASRKKAAQPPETDWKSANVWQKLATARRRFIEGGIEKSGVNPSQSYDYFELADIVPRQTAIFEELGLIELDTYCKPAVVGYVPGSDGEAVPVMSEPEGVATVVNTDNPTEAIEFRMKWGEVEAIISKSSGKAVNMPIQRNGSEETYMRRYLKMLVLDIVEADKVNSVDRDEVEAPAPAKSAKTKAPSASKPKAAKKAFKPVSASERGAAAESVSDPDGPANALQLRALKGSIKSVMVSYGKNHPEVAQYISQLSVETDKLANISKSRCEEAIKALGDFAAEYEKEA
ncbi:ERF family protein [Adlercreutzia sp. R25]|uniref:ERF family protein n=1 Tax=Adlercreutzia shanghongiae TaxID=3111773 RepID=UPI002DBE4992|nr:ERF family protein [Adlercreutzia sp. R25]MEC4272927.1 ERF family protein [Adlercreutzia sp. R25]